VIPARGGSKGIPGKNIKRLAGLPLIAWTIREAKKTKLIDRLIVSTENKKIATVAKKYGAEVPFRRPAYLSRDSTPGIKPILHACRKIVGYTEVVCLQPTSPLRTAKDIDRLIAFARKRSADSVVSVSPAAKHPAWTYQIAPGQALMPFLRKGFTSLRQQLGPAYALNGSVYYARISWILRSKKFLGGRTLGFVLPKERSVDIDDLVDWKIAQSLLKK
jgi:CMP-N,N'-diacetyllegionaminic acid synthase